MAERQQNEERYQPRHCMTCPSAISIPNAPSNPQPSDYAKQSLPIPPSSTPTPPKNQRKRLKPTEPLTGEYPLKSPSLFNRWCVRPKVIHGQHHVSAQVSIGLRQLKKPLDQAASPGALVMVWLSPAACCALASQPSRSACISDLTSERGGWAVAFVLAGAGWAAGAVVVMAAWKESGLFR